MHFPRCPTQWETQSGATNRASEFPTVVSRAIRSLGQDGLVLHRSFRGKDWVHSASYFCQQDSARTWLGIKPAGPSKIGDILLGFAWKPPKKAPCKKDMPTSQSGFVTSVALRHHLVSGHSKNTGARKSTEETPSRESVATRVLFTNRETGMWSGRFMDIDTYFHPPPPPRKSNQHERLTRGKGGSKISPQFACVFLHAALQTGNHR